MIKKLFSIFKSETERKLPDDECKHNWICFECMPQKTRYSETEPGIMREICTICEAKRWKYISLFDKYPWVYEQINMGLSAKILERSLNDE